MKQQAYLENAIEQLKENPIEVCVLWPFSKTSKGYAQTTYNGRRILVHRLAYQLYYEKEPQNLVLHECGNPACYNPEHLYDGDHKQNIEDVIKHFGMFPSGRRKLTENDVIQILEFLENGRLTQQQIADCYRVSYSAISSIKAGRTWRHVTRFSTRPYIREDNTSKQAVIIQPNGKTKPVEKVVENNLTEKQIETAKGLLARGFTLTEVASWFDVSRSKVRSLLQDIP